jgi:hypothetical protein
VGDIKIRYIKYVLHTNQWYWWKHGLYLSDLGLGAVEDLCEHGSERSNSVAQEPEGSSPHSQQLATGPCPEPVESNPHAPSQSP